MADIPAITLPDDLIPGDGRFGSGPSKVDNAAVAALAATGAGYLGTSHRRTDRAPYGGTGAKRARRAPRAPR